MTIESSDITTGSFYHRASSLEDMLEQVEPSEQTIQNEIDYLVELHEEIDEKEGRLYEKSTRTIENTAPELEEQYGIDIWQQLEREAPSQRSSGYIPSPLVTIYEQAKDTYRKYLGHNTGGLGDAAYRMPKE